MICYRIYTEDLDYEGVKKIVDDKFSGYTLLTETGVWEGNTERCIIIEIIATDEAKARIQNIAEKIRDLNSQECVMITTHEVTQEFV